MGIAHSKAVWSDPGVVALPQSRIDFSDMHSMEKNEYEREEWTVCTRCETYRPPRAHHCRICKRCIRLVLVFIYLINFFIKTIFFFDRRMDHHCPWINNCVGERNQKYFLQFLVYVGILSLYSVALVIVSWVYPCQDCSMDLIESQARM